MMIMNEGKPSSLRKNGSIPRVMKSMSMRLHYSETVKAVYILD